MITFETLKNTYPKIADRLAFIDFMLRFTGVVKRSDISEIFNLSDAASSKIIAKYSELKPGNIEYNRTVRANAIVRGSFQSLLDLDSETALGMLANGFNKNKLSNPARTAIPFAKIGRVPNNLSADSVAMITRAINGGYAISCCYISENSENHDRREIVPLGIMHDGSQWMFRGYHRNDSRNIFYKNFHFSRVREIVECSQDNKYKAKPEETLEADKRWNLILPLQLKIHPDRTPEDADRIRNDFGIAETTDELTIEVRCAIMWIVEKQWFIEKKVNSDKKNKQFFKFKLINAEMLKLIMETNL
ncbi:WYL domain-containing protein [Shewanella sp. 3_MG-2023]|uniref:WYL domain-containing protein n=1 Tax=Shewanella sp. 3_MG-2023 TaxID=3062635 RepID=UPI0026E24A67|nr:WYL domain-containing protein [Shewanella sp. 3_MG-2023]MDO6775122.1 WYL domain-containing protein [Shewanella sp. 3_MG-2023]